MTSESTRDVPTYRVTFFFGPEPVEGKSEILFCVFNVKKRSWKAGIQVAVEISNGQLAMLRHKIQLADRFTKNLLAVDPQELSHYQERLAEVFVQAVCWYKLDLQLLAGVTQENQRILADELMDELDQEVSSRSEQLIAYIRDELDLASDHTSISL